MQLKPYSYGIQRHPAALCWCATAAIVVTPYMLLQISALDGFISSSYVKATVPHTWGTFFFFFNKLVNNIIDLAFQDTLWTECSDTCGDLKRSLQKVNENGLLKISLPFKDLCCPYPKDAKQERAFQSSADVPHLTNNFLGAINHSSHCQFPYKIGNRHTKCWISTSLAPHRFSA